MEEFAYELELPDKSGYRFYPVVHVSRLKEVADLGQRPSAKFVDELSENDRFDFDEELLPEDSWELSDTSDKYEVEAILDDKIPNSTSTGRAQRLFKVKWVGYDEPTWEPLSNLSCGGLLFDYLRNKKRERRDKWCKSPTRTNQLISNDPLPSRMQARRDGKLTAYGNTHHRVECRLGGMEKLLQDCIFQYSRL
ncbi:unnamed protein product [Phytophthora fragariaefolia]|uniref:Unnamed protein product n=1 Tax=Phytophthora fragariaefolia TaxID=1490495 RepID=A0A9W7D4Q6_9STRA|nr:unnamed protein product [Phytophthora fragariaefolia]